MAIKVNGKLVAGAGKSAYESAKDGGYTGTEDEFNTSLVNSVTVDGGGVMSMNESFGAAPFTLTFTEDGENDVSASEIAYDNTESGMTATNTQEAIDELFQSVSEGKSMIAAAVTDKGVETAATDSFTAMAVKIGQIETGIDTSDSTAAASDLRLGMVAYGSNGKLVGTMPEVPQQVITPGVSDQTILAGQYLAGTQTIQGDANLVPENIHQGVSIFGIQGSLKEISFITGTFNASGNANWTIPELIGYSNFIITTSVESVLGFGAYITSLIYTDEIKETSYLNITGGGTMITYVNVARTVPTFNSSSGIVSGGPGANFGFIPYRYIAWKS